jgi:type I restriction enzyme S subunit
MIDQKLETTTRTDNDLPQGWVWTTLETCVDILDHRRVPVNSSERQARISGKTKTEIYPYYGATGQVGWIDDYLFDEEIILLGEDGAPFLEPNKSKAYIVRGKSWVNNHAHVLKAIPEITTNSFVQHYLNLFDYHKYVTGTTRLKLNQAQMRKIPIPLPPLAEQRRIVAAIEEQFTRLDAGVAALKRVQASLRRYRAAVLKAACEGKLVPQDPSDEPANILLERILAERRAKWEEEQRARGKDPSKVKYQEPAPPNNEGLPELPKGWCWARFEQLFNELRNGFFAGTPASEPPGIPILRINAVRPRQVILEAPRYLRNVDEDKVNTYKLENGDLLFTRYNGSLDLVGVCGMVRHVSDPILYPDKLIRVRVPRGYILPDYLEIYFATAIPRQIIEKRAKTTAGQQGIAGQDLKGIPVALPPIAEQQRIVAEIERRLSVVDELDTMIAANLKRAERLRQSILKRAFEGRLVPQDPSDEPASVLLERIRREREMRNGQGKKDTRQMRLSIV